MIRKQRYFLGLSVAVWAASVGLTAWKPADTIRNTSADSLRAFYARPLTDWPRPQLDSGVVHHELGLLPPSPVAGIDSLKPFISLGKILFFDPRLSGSGQLSCSSCHDPERSFSDNRSTSVGHDHRLGNRNAPTLLNVWAFERLFWDGRVSSLEEQAVSPIDNVVEMHQPVAALPRKLSKIRGYRTAFRTAYGTEQITEKRIVQALALFQRSIVGRRSRFDQFLKGDHKVLSDQEIQGLHLFRTKARCLNCHNGPLFSDRQFHNIGLTYYGRRFEDLGRYNVTENRADVGKFRTPSLREVMRTGPWMHNGLFDDMDGIVNMYNAGGARTKPKGEQVNDPCFPKTSPLLKPLHLTKDEREAVVAFLGTLTTNGYRIERPELPQ